MSDIISNIKNELNPELEIDQMNSNIKNATIMRIRKVGNNQEETDEIQQNILQKKKLLCILKNGVDFLGYNINIPFLNMIFGKRENRSRNKI